MHLLRAYRATGADLPLQDPRRSHPGVAVEGYFWRVTDVAHGRALAALVGVNRGPAGPWATVGLASSTGFLRTAALPGAEAAPQGLGGRGGAGAGADGGWALEGTAHHLAVDLGPDARADLVLEPLAPWPRRLLGGSSAFQAVPRLNQYWHPWLLGGRATGTVVVGDETWEVDGAQVYGEKNWGAEGFPDSWWWGQAHGFDDAGACVAFAGGQVHARPLGMPLRAEVTALVVRLPSGRVLRLGDPGLTPVGARVDDESWALRGVDRLTGWRVEVVATAPLGAAHVLPVPLPSQGRNTPGALEHLAGTLEVRVARGGRRVWRGTSYLAGLEHGGLARAEAELARRGGRAEPGAAQARAPQRQPRGGLPVSGPASRTRTSPMSR